MSAFITSILPLLLTYLISTGTLPSLSPPTPQLPWTHCTAMWPLNIMAIVPPSVYSSFSFHNIENAGRTASDYCWAVYVRLIFLSSFQDNSWSVVNLYPETNQLNQTTTRQCSPAHEVSRDMIARLSYMEPMKSHDTAHTRSRARIPNNPTDHLS